MNTCFLWGLDVINVSTKGKNAGTSSQMSTINEKAVNVLLGKITENEDSCSPINTFFTILRPTFSHSTTLVSTSQFGYKGSQTREQ